MTTRYARVAVNIPQSRLYTYGVPAEMTLQPGVRVKIPFGGAKKFETGYVIDFVGSIDFDPARLRDIADVIDPEPLVDEHMLKLTRWIADHYGCSHGAVLEAAVPAGVRKRSSKGLGSRYALKAAPLKPTKKQKAVCDFLEASGGSADYDAIAAACDLKNQAVIQVLVQLGAVESVRGGGSVAQDGEKTPLPTFTAQQSAVAAKLVSAVSAASKGEFAFTPFLLHGVTGSGKTEVYMAAIEEAVRHGRQAIVLVPEISLTPQTTRRFLQRFSRVAVLHSGMTEEERCSQWLSIAEGDVDVVIGPRSAVFAPARNLGVIVVDEEHEGSYKQESTPRYNARDVALVRGKMLSVPVVLGSATPALESYKHSLSGRYSLLELPDRVNQKPLPEVHVVDMGSQVQDSANVPILSSSLVDAVQAALDRKEQAILMLNRRGFHTLVLCGSCREVVKCNHCDSSLVYHHDVKRLDCHKCGAGKPAMRRCPSCSGGLFYAGIGTQKLEEAVKARFPHAVVARMDSDSTKERGSHEKILEAVRNRHIDILIGTQMIAKGLDFHNVTVVGVVNADIGLSAPDFRAEERTFQLVAQVAGRTGRGDKDGVVYVQTLQPDSRAIQYASRHDYAGFAQETLQDRSLMGDPPYSRMMRIVARSQDRDLLAKTSLTLADLLASKSPADVKIFGPAACPITRINGEYRMHVVVKANAVSTIRNLLHNVALRYMPPKGVDIATDVDPVSML